MSLPFRADHVGSLLRPAALLEARRSPISPEQIHALEDRQILRVLERQKELGLEIFTDGELRRTNFMSDITEAVEGFDLGDAVQRSWNDDAKAAPQPAGVSSITGIVTSTLKQNQPFTGRELPFLREHSPGPIKITLPSATQFPAISFKYGMAAVPWPFPPVEATIAVICTQKAATTRSRNACSMKSQWIDSCWNTTT